MSRLSLVWKKQSFRPPSATGSLSLQIGIEIVDAERDSLDCRWHPIKGRWGDLPRSRGSS